MQKVNAEEGTNRLNLNLAGLISGNYEVRVENNGETKKAGLIITSN